jgi:DNA modification methylase
MTVTILLGSALDILKTIPDSTIQCVVTSPPYFGLRDYGIDGQIGVEHTPMEYINNLLSIFREVKRTLKNDGTLWVNIGDSYAGSMNGSNDHRNKDGLGMVPSDRYKGQKPGLAGLKSKDLIGIPWMLAFALRSDGWYLRQDIIWSKPNPTPESVKDRCTKSHEYIFLFSKSKHYYYNAEAIKEPQKYTSIRRAYSNNNVSERKDANSNEYAISGNSQNKSYELMRNKLENGWDPNRNKHDVWTITTKPYKGAHFASYPPDLIDPCILAGSRPGDTILDPFNGSGTTGEVAIRHRRNYIGIEIKPEYIKLTNKRLNRVQIMMMEYG